MTVVSSTATTSRCRTPTSTTRATSQKAIGRTLMEAWVRLEREDLNAPDPDQGGGDCVFVTRQGAKIKNRKGLVSYRRASVLPRELLHPRQAAKVIAQFLRGEYEVAVFRCLLLFGPLVAPEVLVANRRLHPPLSF